MEDFPSSMDDYLAQAPAPSLSGQPPHSMSEREIEALDAEALARKEVPPPFVPPEDLRPVEPPADDVLNPHAYGLPGEGGDTWAPQFDKFGPTLDVPGVRIDWNPKQGKRLRRKTAEF